MGKRRRCPADRNRTGRPHRHIGSGYTGGTGDTVQCDVGAGRDGSIVRSAQSSPDLEHSRNRQGLTAITGMVHRPRYRSQKVCPRAADRRGGKRLRRSVNGTGIVASPTDI